MKFRVEVWKSNQNQEEMHYFKADEPNTYLFGFNPLLISERTARKIVDMMVEEIGAKT